MEYYDVIIVGAGIAGCGLAYNLKRIGYTGSVLIIDKEEVGANSGYGHRTVFPSVAREYNLKCIQKYKGVKLGIYNKVIATLPANLIGIDYQGTCHDLYKKTGYNYIKERATDIIGNKLITNKNVYFFKYIIDCSGHNFFLRKILKKKLPFRYWVARTRLIENKTNLDKKYIHYFYGDDEYLEDVYVVGDKIAQGDWIYGKNMQMEVPNPENSFYKKNCLEKDVISVNKNIISVSPALPLVYKNYAFLGDSFGNASPLGVYAMESILKTSKLLSSAIKQNNLKLYEKKWKKKYLNVYLKRLAVKMDLHETSNILKKLKNYPDLFSTIKLFQKYPEVYINMLRNQYEQFELPEEIIKRYPKQRVIWLLFYYLYLRIKYFKIELFN